MATFGKKKPVKKTTARKGTPRPMPQTTAMAPFAVDLDQFAPPKDFEAAMADFPDFSKPFDGFKVGVSKVKIDPEKDFLKTFETLSYRHRAWDVWHDFIVMAACTFSNAVDKENYDARERRYLSIIRKYTDAEERNMFPTLLSHLVMALELNPEQDFLGKLYTTLGLCDKGRQQIFTPYHVCQLMSDVAMGDIVKQVEENGYFSLNDPCCGGGATLIAGINKARTSLAEAGLNFQNHILVTGQDIDETVALMCYLQISLLGVAGYIKVGNSLTEPMNSKDTIENYWFTPMYFSNVWSMRRLIHRMQELERQDRDAPIPEKHPFRLQIRLKKDDCWCSIPEFYLKVAEKAGYAEMDDVRYDCAKIHITETIQETIYNYYGEVRQIDEIGVGMLWLSIGPKADLEGDGYVVEIEDGFIVKGGTSDG